MGLGAHKKATNRLFFPILNPMLEGSTIKVFSSKLERLKEEKVPLLKENEVHVWKFSDFRSDGLSADYLKLLLDKYIPANRDYQILKNENGKPSIDKTFDGKSLQFSLSHSDTYIVFAFTWNRPIGIDVEKHRGIDTVHSISGKYFSEKEWGKLAKAKEDEQIRAFSQLWTLKEAIIKSRGSVVLKDLKELEIDISASPFPLVSKLPKEYGDKRSWKLRSLEKNEFYAMSLAYVL